MSTARDGDAPPGPGTPRWYVLRTMPQHEKKLVGYFQKKGVECYLPLVPRKRQWSDRMRVIEFPLFPGYVFLRFDWHALYKTILSYHGSIDFVRLEGVPQAMPEAQIETLRLIVASERDVHADPDVSFPPGVEIEIRQGPLKGVRGVVVRVKNKQRVFVHVPLLNQTVSAEVDVLDLEKVV